ncbi:MAG: hypothetical protein V3W34_05825 [Phycisphaerae bacterium]
MSISYSTSAPVRPRSTVYTALLLLLATSALAALLSFSRRSIVLGERIHNSGWSISFRAPRSWDRVRSPAIRAADEIVFAAPDASRKGPFLIVEQIDNRAFHRPEDIAESIRVRRGYPGFMGLFARPPDRVYRARFGPFPGLRMEDDSRGIIVAVGIDRDMAFSVQLLSGDTFLTVRDTRLVTKVVDSIERMP